MAAFGAQCRRIGTPPNRRRIVRCAAVGPRNQPAEVNGVDVTGTTAMLRVTVDDYAEVWVNGELPRALDRDNPNLVQGFNKPNRVTISPSVKPGEKIQIAVFGINGPISAAPTNYIWFREAKVEFVRP